MFAFASFRFISHSFIFIFIFIFPAFQWETLHAEYFCPQWQRFCKNDVKRETETGTAREWERERDNLSLFSPQCEIVCAFAVGAKWPTDVGKSMAMGARGAFVLSTQLQKLFWRSFSARIHAKRMWGVNSNPLTPSTLYLNLSWTAICYAHKKKDRWACGQLEVMCGIYL